MHDALIGEREGCVVRSTTGEEVIAFFPTLEEFVLKMPRGAQVVYPKDLAMIVTLGDIYPGATVVEGGAGSGALTIALLRAVGDGGKVFTYEVREDFADAARANVEAFLGKVENLEIHLANLYDAIWETDVDRIVLDLPEPDRALEAVATALRPGGILVSFLPTVLQVHRLAESLRQMRVWRGITTTETLVRPWHMEDSSARPDHRMVAHTGFITVARLVRRD
jgi:tRNA (adenine57-N1/adenine58-N1)-methyltransferase